MRCRTECATLSCCSSERAFHQSRNSSVNSTSHATPIVCHIQNTPCVEDATAPAAHAGFMVRTAHPTSNFLVEQNVPGCIPPLGDHALARKMGLVIAPMPGPHPLPANIASAARARLRIIDSKETRGTSTSFRNSASRSSRCAALGMCAAARSNALMEAARIPAMAR
jgi:hypothetical protein